MRTFNCVCGQTLFFENSRCEACGRDVGWCPACRSISSLEPAGEGHYTCCNAHCGADLAKCSNYAVEAVCNRCVIVVDHVAPAGHTLCETCRYTDTIPDLSVEGNRERWATLEAAKRRLLYALDLLGLPYGRKEDGFEPPLAFAFKGDVVPAEGLWRAMGEAERVYTGHADGQITINIREADDAAREQLRVDLEEAHRTLIGHFRHEIGHYYWDLLVRGECDDAFRDLFGDIDAPNYADALARHYKEGPPAGWRQNFVSAYATMHPWEDWAETFALYLDLTSVLDTANQLGIMKPIPFDNLAGMVDRYRRLGLVLNELNREMGLIDVVPEVITPVIQSKLGFVHDLVRLAAGRG